MTPGATRWDEQLLFRDALRADPTLAERYASLKRDLAVASPDREAYSQAKAEFVSAVVGAARGPSQA